MSEPISQTAARENAFGLPFRGLFLHAWDLAENGVGPVVDWMQQAGLNFACLAATYHNGWFLHPHGKKHRAYLTEGDVAYFWPDKSIYTRTSLRPRIARLSRKQDWLRAMETHSNDQVRLVAWVIGTHNTTFGLANPQWTIQNVYGDRLPHALCPANLEVRKYLKALCRDLGTNYNLWGVQLEAYDWMPFAHGHHHERDLVGLSPLERELMGLCVCPACARRSRKAGVDIDHVKAALRTVLDGAFREAPQRPKGHPRSLIELEEKAPVIAEFYRWRRGFINSLITEIKKESLRGTECRLLLQSPVDRDLSGVVDGFGCASYQQSPAQTLQICRAASKAVPKDWNGLLQCFVQLGMGTPANETQLRDIIRAIHRGGCNGINFYNYSEAPPKMLSWLARTLPAFQE